MQAGKLRHRVDIQSRAATQDSLGEQVHTWTAVATSVPARVEQLSGKELFAAQQINPQISHAIAMRYYSGLDPKNRILWEGRYLDILYIANPDARREQHQLLCLERLDSDAS